MASENVSYESDGIVFIQNDDEVMIFDDFNSAKSDYIQRAAKESFADLLGLSLRVKS